MDSLVVIRLVRHILPAVEAGGMSVIRFGIAGCASRVFRTVEMLDRRCYGTITADTIVIFDGLVSDIGDYRLQCADFRCLALCRFPPVRLFSCVRIEDRRQSAIAGWIGNRRSQTFSHSPFTLQEITSMKYSTVGVWVGYCDRSLDFANVLPHSTP